MNFLQLCSKRVVKEHQFAELVAVITEVQALVLVGNAEG